ncbi:MAG: hypothetical protein R3200_09625 [Xanthomonadales bacterium]|nr:hypothetical protein [Xanthomonadales bacterium]
MKLRIKGNSVRLRLSQTEVRRLAEDRAIWESTDFGSARLHYGIEADPAATAPAAAMAEDRIRVTLPERMAQDWAVGDEVSLHGSIPLATGELKILVEKDFQCLKPREDEDEADLFPNPQAD